MECQESLFLGDFDVCVSRGGPLAPSHNIEKPFAVLYSARCIMHVWQEKNVAWRYLCKLCKERRASVACKCRFVPENMMPRPFLHDRVHEASRPRSEHSPLAFGSSEDFE